MSTPGYDAATPTAGSSAPVAKKKRPITTVIGLLVAVALVIALFAFVVQNTEAANIEFFGLEFEMAQGVALLLAAVVGFLIAVLCSGLLRVRRKVRNRHH
ncbi:lipopolysaccharide assembly protein LapA domain-containing protein [Nocardia sp. 348MFTsu5.1]|uniref:lipopolysaccharide assembly protein LapA domain-containing protein n=1 Tax=Nocardia sp. 348MFTsu5.1 TaxID=1172185 RepID=UPI00036ACBB4|nr:LapA family protein [Nocardia sp. 348MFTsu5.1]